MSKRKASLPEYIITCSECGARANGNSRQADGWTIAPKVLCKDCNGGSSSTILKVPAKERGKAIPIPYYPNLTSKGD